MNLSIKNVPEPLVVLLRERAKSHHRSLQGELMAILEEVLRPQRLTVEAVYRQVRELGLHTEDDAAALVREDRDAR